MRFYVGGWESLAHRTPLKLCRVLSVSSWTGRAKKEIAAGLGIVRQTVLFWEQRFRQRGIEGLEDAPRSGRPLRIGPEKIAQIVHKTLKETPVDSTHWSTRT